MRLKFVPFLETTTHNYFRQVHNMVTSNKCDRIRGFGVSIGRLEPTFKDKAKAHGGGRAKPVVVRR